MPALEPAPPLLADLGPALEPKSRVALEAPGYLHSPPAPAPGEGSTPVTVLEPQSTRESPCPCPVNNQPTEELPDVTTFPPRLLAEQLTLMDALSQTSLSLRRGQYPGTNCSSTSYQPRDPDEGPHWKLSPMKLEFSGFSNKRDWMGTHKSLCLFTNLPFFLSSVHSKSTKYLKQLCKTDTAVKRDLLIKVQWSLGDAGQRLFCFVLTHLLKRLDSAIPDDLDGNINKKRKEVRVLQEMQLLQVAAMNYRLRPLEKFVTYFKRLEQLSDKESYKLSCQLEPKSQ
uniref:Ras-GEF domain-containing protein n=1 Tax=Macaca nemestrina TaxID=9545 RepID=A0A2K6ANI0_MACNE